MIDEGDDTNEGFKKDKTAVDEGVMQMRVLRRLRQPLKTALYIAAVIVAIHDPTTQAVLALITLGIGLAK